MSMINITEAARLMCVHPKTALELVRDGTLPAARIGRAYVLAERDVIAYVEQQIAMQTQQRRFGEARPRRAA